MKKSDIWLLVVLPAEFQGKRSPTSLLWAGREERELEDKCETKILPLGEGEGAGENNHSYILSVQMSFQQWDGDLAQYSKQSSFRGVSRI